MGGFTLHGPTKTIKYLHKTSARCKCPGLHANITKEQEDRFIGRESMTLAEFHNIFNNMYIKEHIHIPYEGAEEPCVLYFTIQDNLNSGIN